MGQCSKQQRRREPAARAARATGSLALNSQLLKTLLKTRFQTRAKPRLRGREAR
jgi:hypothetical protein